MGIAGAQGIFFREAIEKVGDPPGIAPDQPGGLQSIDPEKAGADILFEIVDGIGAQEPEHGDVQLALGCVGGNVLVLAAGVINAVGETAPEGKAVRPHLIPADGAAQDAVFFRGIGNRHGIQHPGTDGSGIEAIYLPEIRHVGIHQPPAFLRGIADAVGAVHPLVKFLALYAPEGNARFPAKRFRDFPPGGNLVCFGSVGSDQLLVPGIQQGIVFQCIGGR